MEGARNYLPIESKLELQTNIDTFPFYPAKLSQQSQQSQCLEMAKLGNQVDIQAKSTIL